MKIFVLSLTLLILGSCSLTASQEQSLNYQMGLYLNAVKSQSIISVVALTHPCYVAYAKSKGNSHFEQSFSINEKETEIIFVDNKIEKIESEDELIQVLYTVRKEFIREGENKEESNKFVALTEDNGKHWFFLKYNIYKSKNICKNLKRLLN